MYIKELKGTDIEGYKLAASEFGTLFDSADLLAVYGDKVRIFGVCDDNGDIIGGFHLYHKKKFGLSVYGNVPFSPSAGPFLKINTSRRVSVNNIWKRTLFLMADFLERLPYSIISVYLSQSVIDAQPFIWNKFKVVPHFTYVLDLDAATEAIWEGFSRQHRHHITKAQKDGLEVRRVQDQEVIKNLVLKTLRLKKNINFHCLDKLISFYVPRNSYALASYKDGVPIAASLFVYDSSTSYLLLSGYDHENKHHGAGSQVIWEGIKHAKGLGLKYFDFEGSMMPPVERFFRDFGGRLVTYYRINKAMLPIEMVLKLYRRELF